MTPNRTTSKTKCWARTGVNPSCPKTPSARRLALAVLPPSPPWPPVSGRRGGRVAAIDEWDGSLGGEAGGRSGATTATATLARRRSRLAVLVVPWLRVGEGRWVVECGGEVGRKGRGRLMVEADEREGAVVAPPMTADAVAVAVAGGSATHGGAERVDARADDVVEIVSGRPSMDVSEMLLHAAQAWRSRRAQREARPDALPPRQPPPPVDAQGRAGEGNRTTRAHGQMVAPVRTADVAVAGGLATHGGERGARSPPPKRRAVSAIRQFPPGCGRDAAVPLGRRRGRGRDADGGGVPPLAGSKEDLPLEAVVEKVASPVDGGDPIANVHRIFIKSSHASGENQVACKVSANLLPKRRIVSATRRFPPGCGREVVVPLAHREGGKVDSGLEFMAVDACGIVSTGNNLVNQELEEGEVADEACCDVGSQNVAVGDSESAATEDVKVMNKCKGTLPKAAEGPSKEHFKGKRECENDSMEKSSMNVAAEVFGDGTMTSKVLSTARKAVKPPLNTLHRRPFSKGKEECAVTNSAPFGPKKKLKVNGAYQSKDIPIKIVSTSGIAGKDNLIDEEALILEDDDILKALAVHDGKLELYLKASSSVQRHGQHGSGNADDRRKIMLLCRRFQFIRRALVHAVQQGSLKVRRADLEADKIVRKLPGFIKPGPIVGNVRGVEVGDEFLYRVELALVGLHRPYQGGIDTADHNGVLVAISIVASGGYPDRLSSSGELIYTGSGGQPAGKKKGEDQKLERGNLALKNCIKTMTPVRVIHGFKGQNGEDDSYSRAKQISTFTYDGLYLVVDYWREGLKGSMVFKYRLQRIHAYR
uniref:YDG domain-containing protein n=1 Tax=Oryza punctata TaxID=4537 RepID=A0A0E0LUN9_ORYPU